MPLRFPAPVAARREIIDCWKELIRSRCSPGALTKSKDGRALLARESEVVAARIEFVENFPINTIWRRHGRGGGYAGLPIIRWHPLEASGSSSMKAGANGVPSISILDGWWLPKAQQHRLATGRALRWRCDRRRSHRCGRRRAVSPA